MVIEFATIVEIGRIMLPIFAIIDMCTLIARSFNSSVVVTTDSRRSNRMIDKYSRTVGIASIIQSQSKRVCEGRAAAIVATRRVEIIDDQGESICNHHQLLMGGSHHHDEVAVELRIGDDEPNLLSAQVFEC
jgi:hypothetical protein